MREMVNKRRRSVFEVEGVKCTDFRNNQRGK